jgi:hypothetical protein
VRLAHLPTGSQYGRPFFCPFRPGNGKKASISDLGYIDFYNPQIISEMRDVILANNVQCAGHGFDCTHSVFGAFS